MSRIPRIIFLRAALLCGGTSPSRRLYGETLFSMYTAYNFGKRWFVSSLEKKAITPEKLPIDQHQLPALTAPRSVSVHSATKDQWADPRKEYLSLYLAGEVFKLYGKTDILTSPEPPLSGPAGGLHASYYLRKGSHDILKEDWIHYLDIADRLFCSK